MTSPDPGSCEERFDTFVDHAGWFDRRYATLCGGRFPTLKLALNLFVQAGPGTIVETGCMRGRAEWGDGCSTLLFAEVVAHHGGCLWSVDHDPRAVRIARRRTSFAAPRRRIVLDDATRFLRHGLSIRRDFSGRIDLLYLDSLDYPVQGLFDVARFSEPETVLLDAPDERIARSYSELVEPSQMRCLEELQAAWPLLHAGSVVLFDDNAWPGGGSPRLARRHLLGEGWRCLLDLEQSVWVPGGTRRPASSVPPIS